MTPSAPADAHDPQSALERLLAAATPDPSWFSPAFLASVPFASIRSTVEQARAQLGPIDSVEPAGDAVRVLGTEDWIRVELELDRAGRFTRLVLGAPRRLRPDLDRVRGELAALTCPVGAVVTVDDRRVLDVHGDRQLAAGSAFKLVILAEVMERIAAGAMAWDQVAQLSDGARALASGILQTWPAGTTLTVETLATLMTSLSDNTAADVLASIVGRDALERRSQRNRPFLTTREFFVLRLPGAEDLLERWRRADGRERRAVLDVVATRPLPPARPPANLTLELSVEWWFTPAELSDLIREVEPFRGLTVNQGLADPHNWTRIAYKGGWEPGAMSWSTAARDEDGRTCTAVLVANRSGERPIPERRLASLYREALDAARLVARRRP